MIAQTRAIFKSIRFVHNPQDRMEIEETLHIVAPFWFAKNQAIRRAGGCSPPTPAPSSSTSSQPGRPEHGAPRQPATARATSSSPGRLGDRFGGDGLRSTWLGQGPAQGRPRRPTLRVDPRRPRRLARHHAEHRAVVAATARPPLARRSPWSRPCSSPALGPARGHPGARCSPTSPRPRQRRWPTTRSAPVGVDRPVVDLPDAQLHPPALRRDRRPSTANSNASGRAPTRPSSTPCSALVEQGGGTMSLTQVVPSDLAPRAPRAARRSPPSANDLAAGPTDQAGQGHDGGRTSSSALLISGRVPGLRLSLNQADLKLPSRVPGLHHQGPRQPHRGVDKFMQGPPRRRGRHRVHHLVERGRRLGRDGQGRRSGCRPTWTRSTTTPTPPSI